MQEVIVLKCGGSSVNDLGNGFFANVKTLQRAGKKVIVIHGGGADIQNMLNRYQMNNEFVDGLRKTTDRMMDIVEMVLSGKVNPALTRQFHQYRIKAVGLHGSDVFTATTINQSKYGQVGEITSVNTAFIHMLLRENMIPIISPVALDEGGLRLNVNADTTAGAVASVLQAKQLVFVTDVDGILCGDTLLDKVTVNEMKQLIKDSTIYGGMIPKVEAALKGLQGGVQEVVIVNGRKWKVHKGALISGTAITK